MSLPSQNSLLLFTSEVKGSVCAVGGAGGSGGRETTVRLHCMRGEYKNGRRVLEGAGKSFPLIGVKQSNLTVSSINNVYFFIKIILLCR